MPWRSVERYTFAQLKGESILRVVPYAEPFVVEVQLREDSPWKPASAEARYGDGKPVIAALTGERYRFGMPAQATVGSVSLSVGDARRVVPVELKMRPALEKLVVDVQLPAYLERTQSLTRDVRGGTISLLRGSSAVLRATATRELAQATLNDQPQRIDGARMMSARFEGTSSSELRLMWIDRFGLSAREPQVIRLEVLGDEAPTVGIAKVKNHQVVLSSEVLVLEVHAADDFGLKRVGLEWEGIEHATFKSRALDGREDRRGRRADEGRTDRSGDVLRRSRERPSPESSSSCVRRRLSSGEGAGVLAEPRSTRAHSRGSLQVAHRADGTLGWRGARGLRQGAATRRDEQRTAGVVAGGSRTIPHSARRSRSRRPPSTRTPRSSQV